MTQNFKNILDEQENKTAELSSRTHRPIADSKETHPPVTVCPNHQLLNFVRRTQRALEQISGAVTSATASKIDLNKCPLAQYVSQLHVGKVKAQLSLISREVASLEPEDKDLSELEDNVYKFHFDISLKLHCSLHGEDKSLISLNDKTGVKLPRLEVPSFNGNFVNWQLFREQYCISVHDKTKFSDSEKLVYLVCSERMLVKHVVEGLSSSGDDYTKAADCLQKRYEWPRLIYQVHVQVNSRELQRLHDTANQHLRTLKAMGCEPSRQFITSALELKFDDNTMFEWKKYNQVSSSVPHYSSLLTFLGLCTQVTETWKGRSHSHQVTSFITGVEETASTHPLYACHQFKTLPHDLMINTVNTNGSA